ncbi:MAG: hypothetical protein KC419_23870 [Anaerolineales bacterium]|nr:hypothetical protein [Anaerolineales bacterium]MCA9931553.1 hypothetical protein [Anaerolineales bacterium]
MTVKKVLFGRKQFSFDHGVQKLERMSITEKPLKGEDESCFTERLMRQYGDQQGEIEVVIKSGRPEYAIITFELDESAV